MFSAIQLSSVNLRPSAAGFQRYMVRGIALVPGALITLVAVCLSGCEKKEQVQAPPPPDVEVVEVVQRDVPIFRDWVATLDGFVNAQVRAQVSGYLLKQTYNNGAFVRKGDTLFQIDPRPFQAALDQSKANLAASQGSLQQARARLGKTELDVARYTPLARESAVSQQDLDDAIQANLAAKAQVQTAEAAIDAAKAAVDNAQLNLGFTTITSPIDGVSSIATAQVGDLVGPQTPALTTVSTVNPILVNFTVSEQDYLNSTRLSGGNEAEIRRLVVFSLTLADGSTFPQKGRLYAIDRQIDVRTGAVLIQAVFPNPGNVLRPGGFGRIGAVVGVQRRALMVPQRAVSELQGGFLVAVVGSENKISIRTVKTGQRVGPLWIITDGLKPGEKVVAEGTQRVREGSVVNPKPFQERAAAKTP